MLENSTYNLSHDAQAALGVATVALGIAALIGFVHVVRLGLDVLAVLWRAWCCQRAQSPSALAIEVEGIATRQTRRATRHTS